MNHFDKIALALPAAGLDGVLLTGEYNRFYASGFATTGTDGVALVTTEGNFYFTDSRYIEAAENTVENAAIGLADREKGYVAWLGEALALTGARRIGFEDETMTVAEHRLYSEKLQAVLVPASAFLRELRAQKDPEELERMEQAQRIAEKALGQILAEIRPGVTEKEIAARLQYLMLHFGAERMSFDPIVASGPNGSMPHAVPTERRIQTGEFVTMDFGCVYKGYCSDMTRTVCVGRPTEEMKRVYETVLRAQLTGIAAARAGATGAQIDMGRKVRYPSVRNPRELGEQFYTVLDSMDDAVLVEPVMAAEDFAEYQQEIPGLFFFLGVQEPTGTAPLHSSHFNFDERVLLTGVETFKRILECESKCTKKK